MLLPEDIIGLAQDMIENRRSLEESAHFTNTILLPATQKYRGRLDMQACYTRMLLYLDKLEDPNDPRYQDEAILHLQDLLDTTRFPKWWLGWWQAGLAIRQLDFYLGLACVCKALVLAPGREKEDWLLSQTEIHFREDDIPPAFFSRVTFWKDGSYLAEEFLAFGSP